MSGLDSFVPHGTHKEYSFSSSIQSRAERAVRRGGYVPRCTTTTAHCTVLRCGGALVGPVRPLGDSWDRPSSLGGPLVHRPHGDGGD